MTYYVKNMRGYHKPWKVARSNDDMIVLEYRRVESAERAADLLRKGHSRELVMDAAPDNTEMVHFGSLVNLETAFHGLVPCKIVLCERTSIPGAPNDAYVQPHVVLRVTADRPGFYRGALIELRGDKVSQKIVARKTRRSNGKILVSPVIVDPKWKDPNK